MASRSKAGAGKSLRRKSATVRKSASERRIKVPGSDRDPVKGAKLVGKARSGSKLEVTVTLRGPKLPDAARLSRGALSPARFRARYSASKRDVDKVTRRLRHEGMTILEVSRETRSIRVRGTVAQMECVFVPQLCMFESKKLGRFRDREHDYKVPLSLKNIVTGVMGFGTRPVVLRKPRLTKKRRRFKRPRIGAGLHKLGPEELEKLYRFPPGSAAGQKIAVAEFGGGYFGKDARLFSRLCGRPAPSIRTIRINTPVHNRAQLERLPHGRRADAIDDASEVMMDVEIIAALCPSAEIAVYFATEDQKGWLDLLERVIRDRPAVVSVSWGSAEDSTDWSGAALKAINERLQMAAALGITICIAAGDDGTGDEQTDGRAHLDFPSVSPYVLTVGGTMLKHERGMITEQVWWESPGKRTDRGGGSTGGGISTRFRRPKWQDVKIVSLNKGGFDGRVVPDVAALAGPPAYDMIFEGRHAYGAGTSASAPLWAALIARVYALLPPDKRQRFLTPLFYQKSKFGPPIGSIVCQDITVGHNRSRPPGFGYQATVGFDAVSGWGTPIGTALLLALS